MTGTVEALLIARISSHKTTHNCANNHYSKYKRYLLPLFLVISFRSIGKFGYFTKMIDLFDQMKFSFSFIGPVYF